LHAAFIDGISEMTGKVTVTEIYVTSITTYFRNSKSRHVCRHYVWHI